MPEAPKIRFATPDRVAVDADGYVWRYFAHMALGRGVLDVADTHREHLGETMTPAGQLEELASYGLTFEVTFSPEDEHGPANWQVCVAHSKTSFITEEFDSTNLEEAMWAALAWVATWEPPEEPPVVHWTQPKVAKRKPAGELLLDLT